MSRDPVQTGLLIAKRRHQLNRNGQPRRPGEPLMRQADLAARLGVAVSTVANWERGQSYPERHLGAVEQVLGITLTDDGTQAAHPDVYEDPDEARIWGWDDLSPAKRRAMIEDLRTARRAADRAAKPTGT